MLLYLQVRVRGDITQHIRVWQKAITLLRGLLPLQISKKISWRNGHNRCRVLDRLCGAFFIFHHPADSWLLCSSVETQGWTLGSNFTMHYPKIEISKYKISPLWIYYSEWLSYCMPVCVTWTNVTMWQKLKNSHFGAWCDDNLKCWTGFQHRKV